MDREQAAADGQRSRKLSPSSSAEKQIALEHQPSALVSSGGSAAGPNPLPSTSLAASSLLTSSSAIGSAIQRPRHWSVFYPSGIDEQPPCQLHYLYVGCWSTTSCDYFLHRNPAKGEVLGHKVIWLHNAEPRDRFVFVVSPVEERNKRSLWGQLWTFVYGTPPAFALSRSVRKDQVLSSSSSSSVASQQASRTPADHGLTPPVSPGLKANLPPGAGQSDYKLGVEVIEVLHSDITAMDYCPGLTGSRLAIEAQTVSAHWFPHINNVYAFYKCSPFQQQQQQQNVSSSSNAPSRAASVLSPAFFATSRLATDKVRTPGLVPMLDGELSIPLPPVTATNKAAKDTGKRGLHSAPNDEVIPPSRSRSSCDEGSSPNASLVHSGTEVPTDFELPEATTTGLLAEVGSRSSTPCRSTTLPPTRSEQHLDSPGAVKPSALGTSATGGVECVSGNPLTFKNEEDVSSKGSPEKPPVPGCSRPDSRSSSFDTDPRSPLLVAPITTRHTNTMVVVSTQDPHFNAIFREILIPEPGTHPYNGSIAEQKRLLGLYEAGMPSWTIFISRWGLPYRRRYRLFFVMLINMWPVIALCVGLYDLYKHLPFVKDFLADALSPLSLWVNNHFVVYMSMMITYIFTVSFSVLHGFYMSVKGMMSVVSFLLYPFVPLFHFLLLLKYPLLVVWNVATLLLTPLYVLGSTVVGLVGTLLYAPFMVIRTLFSLLGGSGGATAVTATNIGYYALWWRSWLDFWDKVARPLKNVAKACYDGILHVGVSLARREASIRRAYTVRVNVWIDVVRTNFAILSSFRTLTVHCLAILVVAVVTIYLSWDTICEAVL